MAAKTVSDIVDAGPEMDELSLTLDSDTAAQACHACVEHYRQLEDNCGTSDFGSMYHAGDFNGGIANFVDLSTLIH